MIGFKRGLPCVFATGLPGVFETGCAFETAFGVPELLYPLGSDSLTFLDSLVAEIERILAC